MVCVDKLLYLPKGQDLSEYLARWNKNPLPGWILGLCHCYCQHQHRVGYQHRRNPNNCLDLQGRLEHHHFCIANSRRSRSWDMTVNCNPLGKRVSTLPKRLDLPFVTLAKLNKKLKENLY